MFLIIKTIFVSRKDKPGKHDFNFPNNDYICEWEVKIQTYQEVWLKKTLCN